MWLRSIGSLTSALGTSKDAERSLPGDGGVFDQVELAVKRVNLAHDIIDFDATKYNCS